MKRTLFSEDEAELETNFTSQTPLENKLLGS